MELTRIDNETADYVIDLIDTLMNDPITQFNYPNSKKSIFKNDFLSPNFMYDLKNQNIYAYKTQINDDPIPIVKNFSDSESDAFIKLQLNKKRHKIIESYGEHNDFSDNAKISSTRKNNVTTIVPEPQKIDSQVLNSQEEQRTEKLIFYIDLAIIIVDVFNGLFYKFYKMIFNNCSLLRDNFKYFDSILQKLNEKRD